MARIGKRDKEYQRKIARERAAILLTMAERVAKEDPVLSRRYVDLALRVAKKHRVRLSEWKRRFCKRCKTFWTADTLRVRLVSSPYPTVVYKCLVCGEEYRVPYVREKKEKGGGVGKPNRGS